MFRFVCFLMTFLLICPLSSSSQQNIIPPDENQKSLAEHAIFPEKEHKEWLEVQKNPGIDSASKIKCTIDTFLILKYESLKKGMLFDFGFLFDLSDEQGEHEYANERGSLFLRIVGWRALGNLIEHYDYRPRYRDIDIRGKLAKASMYSSDHIVHFDSPDILNNFGWGGYEISLTKIDENWLIYHLDSTDETYTMFPRETDFLIEAKRILENNLTNKDFEITRSEVLQKRKEQALILYAEIAGEYVFEQKEKKIAISFGVINSKFVAKFEELDLGIRLIPLSRRDMAFSAITPTGEIYDLQFVRNSLGNVAKCQMNILDRQHIGIKTKQGSNLNVSMDVFPGYNKAYYAELEADAKRYDTDPRLKEFIERRRERQKEHFARQREEGEKRIQIYHEISGKYRFEIEKEFVSIFFYVQDRYLLGIFDDSSEGVVLQRIEKDPLEFEFRPHHNVVYTLRFQRGKDGNIKKCFIQIENQLYEGEKLDILNHQNQKKNTIGE